MKAVTIAALFVASVLLIGVSGAASPAYANHPVLVEGNYFGESPLSFLKIFSGFAWWGAEESEKERLAFSNSLQERDLSG